MSYSIATKTYGATNALLKMAVQDLIDGLTGSGWAVADDTGQLDPATIIADLPGSDTTLGYLVFVLDDSHRATDPVYLRASMEVLGVGYSNPGWPYYCIQARFTFGFATDGAGAITGNQLSCGTHASGTGYDLTFKTALNVFAGGDGWATAFFGVSPAYNGTAFLIRQVGAFSICRMRDKDGVVEAGKLFIAYPEPSRIGNWGINNAYEPGFRDGSREGFSTRLVGAYLPKTGAGAQTGISISPGIIGDAARSGSVDGVIQAQPTWMFFPQIQQFSGIVLIPSGIIAVGEVFTASVDGLNVHEYACLGTISSTTSVGAAYGIDSFSARSYCYAVRVS